MMFNCHVDEYFTGMWGHENLKYPICSDIRTIFVVMFSIVFYCVCQIYRQIFIFIIYTPIMWCCLFLL